MPKFGFGAKSPKADVKSPTLDMSVPEAELNVESPDVAISAKGKKSKFKMPKLHMSGPKVKGKKGGFDVSGEMEANLKSPDVEGSLSVPDASLKADANIKSPKGKKPVFGKLSFPDVEFDIKSPMFKADASLPKVEGEVKMPGIGVTSPSLEASVPSGSASVNIGGPNIGLKAPEFKHSGESIGLAAPKLEGDLRIPSAEANLTIPDINLKGPSVNVPPVDVSAPSFSAPGVDVHLKGPKLKGDVDLPGAELQGPGGKLKFPKFSLPKFGKPGANLEGPDVDIQGQLPSAHLDVSCPRIEGEASIPEMDMNLKGPKLGKDLGISGEIKAPKMDVGMPDVGVGGFEGKFQMQKPSGLDVNLTAPDVDMKGPKVKMTSEGGISEPEVDINLKGPKIKGDFSISGSMTSPKVEGSGGAVKLPCMKLPQFAVAGEGGSISGPQIKGPEVDFDLNMKGPSLKGDAQFATDLKGQHIGLEMPGMKVSGLDLDTGAPDICLRGPSLNVSGPKVSEPDFDVNLKGPKSKTPELHMGAKGTGDFHFSGPKIGGDLSGPKLGIKGPSVGMDAPQGHLESSPGKVFFPKMKIPKFVVAGQEPVGREVGVDVEFPQPPQASLHVEAGTVELEEPDLKLKKSKIKMPRFAFSKPKVKGSVGSPEVSTSGAGVEGELKASLGSLEGEVETKKSRHRSSSFSDEHSSHSTPTGTLEHEGDKGKHAKIKFGTFGGIGSKSKGSYEVTGSDDEAGRTQGSGASLESKKSRLSSSSSNESGTKAAFRVPVVELTVAKKKE
ncbi:hypothetical protein E2320_013765 [Naja naja]|nr:hypothetical protein E2320_013765 [Naja naja]